MPERADKYMRLTYTPFVGNLQEFAKGYMDFFTPKDCDEDQDNVPEFVEAMIYSPTEVVFMTGRYASKEETKKKGNNINSLGWSFKPWFYQHAKSALKKGDFLEYIPTKEYYHRHTRHLYWEGKPILPFGDQWWFRFLLGWLKPSKVSLLKGTQREAIRNYYHEMHVIQDMLVPLYKMGDALEWVHQEMELRYPNQQIPRTSPIIGSYEPSSVEGNTFPYGCTEMKISRRHRYGCIPKAIHYPVRR
ncbi:hypothetical protein GOBAR_DD03952 [Gossypium barbadense]|nr:hypothetical protein GOBAR_DD03952 [Gossypium barbadense]